MRERPRSFPVHFGKVRRAEIEPFANAVFFVIRPNRLSVLGVIDLRRDPAYIARRLGH